MAEVTVALGAERTAVFVVSWAEPMRAEFETRIAAERFMAWLRAAGATLDIDGSCQACAAHHAIDHDCPACGASLDLRVKPTTPLRRPAPLQTPALAVAVEQQRIRYEQARAAYERRLAEYRSLVCYDRVLGGEEAC